MKTAIQFLGIYLAIFVIGIVMATEAQPIEGSAFTIYKVGTTGFSCLVIDKNKLSPNCGYQVHEMQVRAIKVRNQLIQRAKKVERVKSIVKDYEDILRYMYDLHKQETLRSA